MREYLVTRPCHAEQYYLIEADSKKAACEKVNAGEGEPLDFKIIWMSKAREAILSTKRPSGEDE